MKTPETSQNTLKNHVTNCIPARLFATGSFGWSFADPSHHDKGQHAKTIEIHRVAVLSYRFVFFSEKSQISGMYIIWLVDSTHLKNNSQNGNLPQIGVKINNIRNHHLVM